MLTKAELSPFGIGTWTIGGIMTRDENNDDVVQVNAIKYTLEKGINYIDASKMYAGGYALELIRRAIEGFNRENIFITAKLEKPVDTLGEVEVQLDGYLKELGVEYVDCFQMHSPTVASIGIAAAAEAMAKLIEKKKTRYIGMSNFVQKELEEAENSSGQKLFMNEIDYNFEVRYYDEDGTVKYCIDKDLLVMPFQPLRRNKTSQKGYELLARLAKKNGKTQNQIVLSWLTHKLGFMPLIKSTTISHIDENIESAKFELTRSEVLEIEKVRIGGYKTEENGQRVTQLSNTLS